LPLSAIFGAMLVTLCDCAARTLFAPCELPTGIVLSAVGAPFFIMLLLRHKGGHGS
ncbi:MAG: iron ABC transporter permease, partial [Oscillospiraceae bacterium]|nr:iron ABC transporter permease [Oscillospiraceae bacterium]